MKSGEPMRKVSMLDAGSNSPSPARIVSISLSARRAWSRSIRARSVGTMPLVWRTSRGSPKISRRRLRAMLTVGCDWFSRMAVRETLRSLTSITSTRSR